MTSALQKARNRMEDAGISLLVITPSSDLMYLTGYSKPATDRLTALLLTEHRLLFPVSCRGKKLFKRGGLPGSPHFLGRQRGPI